MLKHSQTAWFDNRGDPNKSFTSNADSIEEYLLDDDNVVLRRLSMVQSRKGKKKDMFEDMPFFKDVLKKRDRDALREALTEETYKDGDVIFNYGTLQLFYFHVLASNNNSPCFPDFARLTALTCFL